jgi:hypothetical protein
MPIQERMDANTKAMQQRMERQIGSLVSIMEAARKPNRDEKRQETRADQEHIKNNGNTSRQTGWLVKTDAGRPRSEQGHGYEGIY